MFSDLIGNNGAKHYLSRMVQKDALGNSLLFAGPAGVGKTLFALKLAEHLLGRAGHPDLHIYRPEGKVGLHSMESMRDFCKEVYMAPFEAKWKIFIIQDADRMLPTSANALLKTFEEPAKQSLIILVSHKPEHLLPTVLSRCRTVHFASLSDEEVATYLQQKLPKERADQIALLAEGSLETACRFLDEKSSQLRQKAIELLKSGGFADYTHLSNTCKMLADEMEGSQDEEQIRQEIYSGNLEDLSAAQKNSIGKEVEGMVRLKQSDLVKQFFLHVLSWYRDLHLLQSGGNSAYLMHKDSLEELRENLDRALPIKVVTKIIQEVSQAYDRSGTLSICLENLFLKLNYL